MALSDDLRRLAEQEQALALSVLDAAFAWQLGSQLHDLATARHLPVAIDVRRFGQPLFYAALAGSTPDNAAWIRRKSKVVARFYRSSYAIGLSLEAQGTSLLEKYGLPLLDYAAHGGSFPLVLAGTGAVGSVTVSGLKQRDDHALVVEALCTVLERDHAMLALD